MARNKAFQEVERARKAAEDAGACSSACLRPLTLGIVFSRFYLMLSLSHVFVFCMLLYLQTQHNRKRSSGKHTVGDGERREGKA